MAGWIAFGLLALAAVAAGFAVFAFRSMVRAAFALLVSFMATAGMLLLLESEFLFAITLLMMIGEMVIMAVFMVAFMMNPAGLEPMRMVHQPRVAVLAGAALFLLVSAVALTSPFPVASHPMPADVTAALGHELLGRSMLPFETVGVVLLAAMIAVVTIAARCGRFGEAVRRTVPSPLPLHPSR